MLQYMKNKTAIIVIAVLFLVADVFVKSYFFFVRPDISIFGGILRFHFVKNYNIAFSLPLSGVLLNAVVILVLSAVFFWLVRVFRSGPSPEVLSLIFIFFGGLGNLTDRFARGFVVDYVDLGWFPVFNISDAMITVGALGLGYLLLFGKLS
jgi:signal peptidase II